jgi:hypothetical protein
MSTYRVALLLILLLPVPVAHAQPSATLTNDQFLRLITDWCLDHAPQCIGRNGTDGRNGQDGRNGLDGRNGQDGKDGKDATATVCPAIPERDLPAAFDFTISTFIENNCAAQVLAYDRTLHTAVLVDLRTWMYQAVPNYMPGHVFTKMEASRTDPYKVVLSNEHGFWFSRWPVETLTWAPIHDDRR